MRAAKRAGFQVRRVAPAYSDDLALVAHLRQFGVDLILDVGANRGQFAVGLLEAGYQGRILSFEPLSGPHREAAKAAASRPAWEVWPRCAVGDSPGEITVQISANSVASSAVPLTEAHVSVSPDAAYVGSETAPVLTLDQIADHVLAGSARPFLKIDVQGYEQRVLAGAEKLLPKLVGLQMEASLVAVYEGQWLFPDVVRWIDDRGFRVYRISPSFVDPQAGRWLQADLLCFRQRTSAS